MPARKRPIEEVQLEDTPAPTVSPFLQKLRSTWEFACLMQYIYLFGDCVKINSDVDIEMLEMECSKSVPSDLLPQIGLALLKHVSSHRGLTPEIFDEYTRRQYTAKLPHRNPYGEDEEPRKFADFDVFTKIRVLHQLSIWTLNNPNRIREYYAQSVPDQTQWRMEEFGWDRHNRSYFVLDDSRMYRLTKPVIKAPTKPIPKQKQKPKPKPQPVTKGSRSSKRQKLEHVDNAERENEKEEAVDEPEETQDEDNGLGGAKWECIAVSSDDYVTFIDGIRKSKDSDEKDMVKRMQDEIMPEIERQAASRERKAAQQRKELFNIERLATAKRSSRLADKQDKAKEEQEAKEAERKQREDLAMARREQEKQRKLEDARDSRMMTREQRLKEREVKRILHEDELRKLEEQSHDADSVDGRSSERQRKTEMERQKQELQKWTEAEDEWYFDCAICGVHGKNLDDGTHSIACEKCDTWQHSACHGIKEADAEKDDFHFLCASCSAPRQIKLKPSSRSPEDSKKRTTSETFQPNGVPQPNVQADQGASRISQMQPAAIVAPPSRPPQQHWATTQTTHYNHVDGSANPLNLHHPYQHPSTSQQPQSAGHQSSHGSQLPYTSTTQIGPSSVYNTNGTNVTQAYTPRAQSQHTTSQHIQNGQSYNPYQNNFPYQGRPPSAHRPLSSSSSSTPRPLSSQMPTPGQQPSFASPHLQHPTHQHATPQPSIYHPTMAASPTPSLSATQGQTNVRFSPTMQNHGHHAHAYMPNDTRPTPAAISPVKHDSPVTSSNAQSTVPGSSQAAAVTGTHAPSLHSTSPSAGKREAGISPIKHDMPPSSPLAAPLEPARPLQTAASFGLDGIIESPTKPKAAGSPMGPLSSNPAITSPPLLQPNAGLANGLGISLERPVKKGTGSPMQTANGFHGEDPF